MNKQKTCFVCNRWAPQMALEVKNLPVNAGDLKRLRFDPWVMMIPWRRALQPTPVFYTYYLMEILKFKSY